MQTVHRSSRGQVLIIFVFAIVGLIGIAGLAIDGGNIYQHRRQAQNAADTSAMAVALTKVHWDKQNGRCDNFNTATPLTPPCSDSIIQAGWSTASNNGFDGVMSNTVHVYNPPKDGPYTVSSNCVDFNCNNYVEVIITSQIPTFFAKVLGISTLSNQVEAVALARYRPEKQLYGEDALVILAPEAVSGKSGEFVTKGTAAAYVHGGNVFVNSNGPGAFTEESGCIDFQMDSGKYINVVGQMKASSCSTPPPTQLGVPPRMFPPDEPFPNEPAECGFDGYWTNDLTSGPYSGYTHGHPGHYTTAGSNKFPQDKDTFLDPGVYCIDALVKTSNPSTHLIGDNVFLYIRKGGSFNFGGGTAQLTAPSSGKYAGYLIYAAPNYGANWRTTSPANCSINAAADDLFTGVIWAPFCDTTLNGSAGTLGLKAKLVVYTLLINGNQALNFYYDVGSNPKVPEGIYLGLYH